MLLKALQIFLRMFLLFWLLTLEKSIGLPVAFLALSWQWVGSFHRDEVLKRQAILCLLGCLFAILYTVPFSIGIVLLEVGAFIPLESMKNVIFSRWKWLTFSIFVSLCLFFIQNFEWNFWLVVQGMVSAGFVIFVQKKKYL